jgi:translation initiation factor 2 gamma subunit (eIF-2gamma)
MGGRHEAPGNDVFMTAVVLGLAVFLAALLVLAALNP